MSCCYKCEDRYVGCHSKCEKYLEELEQIKEVKAKRLQDSIIDSTIHTNGRDRLKKKGATNNFKKF